MSSRRFKQGGLPKRWGRLRHVSGQNAERCSNVPGLLWRGDLLEGVVAVAALLVMVAIGVSLWLTIPLSILTYVGVALLRPALDDQRATIPSPDPGQIVNEAVSDDVDHHQPTVDVPLAAASAVATHFGLTPRESEILPLLAQRLTDREIAERLSISHRTAMNHVANILGKLGVASRRDVAPFIARHALLPPSKSPNRPE
jgi:DNA-binding CsgD family transcriptional regulator